MEGHPIKTFALLVTLLLLVVVVGYVQAQVDPQDLEEWCKFNGQRWDSGTCYAENGDCGGWLIIEAGEKLVMDGQISGRCHINSWGTIEILGTLEKPGGIEIMEGGQLLNLGEITLALVWNPEPSMFDCIEGRIVNYGTVLNMGTINNYAFTQFVTCAGVIRNNETASFFNYSTLNILRADFRNLGNFYYWSCGGGSQDNTIEGAVIVFDICNYMPQVVME